MIRKHISLIVALTILLAAGSAGASGAPNSQFYFKGWPYRQSTPCQVQETTCPTALPVQPSPAPTLEPPVVPTEEPITPTLAPGEPTVAPTAEPTSKPTVAPTAVPTTKPTPKPTIVPTAKPTAVPTQTPSTDDEDDYTTESLTAQEQTAWNLLNQDRINNGLPALAMDAELSRIARLKSKDMRQNNYFAHESPTYGSASQMLTSFGYKFTSVGENIAHHATVEKSQAAFMSSAGHKRNILGSQWTKVGIGVYYDANGFVYVTQLFVR